MSNINQPTQDLFTILYQVRDQKYLIGIMNDRIPLIAAMGVNTERPLPCNIRGALVQTVMELKQMQDEPKVIDYNAASKRSTDAILANFAVNPMMFEERPIKSVPEVLEELKTKMYQEKEQYN